MSRGSENELDISCPKVLGQHCPETRVKPGQRPRYVLGVLRLSSNMRCCPSHGDWCHAGVGSWFCLGATAAGLWACRDHVMSPHTQTTSPCIYGPLWRAPARSNGSQWSLTASCRNACAAQVEGHSCALSLAKANRCARDVVSLAGGAMIPPPSVCCWGSAHAGFCARLVSPQFLLAPSGPLRPVVVAPRNVSGVPVPCGNNRRSIHGRSLFLRSRFWVGVSDFRPCFLLGSGFPEGLGTGLHPRAAPASPRSWGHMLRGRACGRRTCGARACFR